MATIKSVNGNLPFGALKIHWPYFNWWAELSPKDSATHSSIIGNYFCFCFCFCAGTAVPLIGFGSCRLCRAPSRRCSTRRWPCTTWSPRSSTRIPPGAPTSGRRAVARARARSQDVNSILNKSLGKYLHHRLPLTWRPLVCVCGVLRSLILTVWLMMMLILASLPV